MPMSSRRLLLALATSPTWERAVRALPVGERLAYRRALRYVAGWRREDALACAWSLAGEGLASSIDLFGESVADPAAAEAVADDYVALAGALEEAPPDAALSIDLSHIGVDEPGDGPRRRLERIAAALPPGRMIQVGAEQAARADRILELVLAVAGAGAILSATVQANLRRSPADAERLAAAGVPVRLVKGAYAEEPRIAHPWGEPTDLAYLGIAHTLATAGATVLLATHDRVLREALLAAHPNLAVEMLLGVRPADARQLAADGVPVRIYVPYGPDWFRYAMRRWAESRGAR